MAYVADAQYVDLPDGRVGVRMALSTGHVTIIPGPRPRPYDWQVDGEALDHDTPAHV